jgi:hypothetical protein
MAKRQSVATPNAALNMALLASIASGAVARLSQADATPLMTAGFITANTADVVDGLAAVALTEAGTAALTEAGKPAASSEIAIDDGVAMPSGQRRAPRETVYPFEKLAVGQSFHVAKTAENPDPAARLSSSVSGARIRFSEQLKDDAGNLLTETVERSTYAKNSDGSFVKGADGKRVKTGTETISRPKMGEPSRDFTVKAVGADDPRGEGARCWRTK